MCKLFNLVLPLVAQIVSSQQGIFELDLTIDGRRNLLSSLAFSVCKNLVFKSDQALLYTVELGSDPSFAHFNQRLHEVSIQTISVSQHSRLTKSVVPCHAKNILFSLRDFNELFDLIFYSISRQGPSEFNRTSSFVSLDLGGTEYSSEEILPHYCIKIDGNFPQARYGKKCDEVLEITSAELKGDPILNDSVFAATRGLYVNKIWNSKNHLIFILKNFRENHGKFKVETLQKTWYFENANETIANETGASDLEFCFKFFWRFFKGRKTVICLPENCYRYDPFTENLIPYGGEDDEQFFDFSLRNMHQKQVGVYIDFFNSLQVHIASSPSWSNWKYFLLVVLDRLKTKMNCTITLKNLMIEEEGESIREVETGLKFDVDLDAFVPGIGDDSVIDYSKTDFSVGVDTSALCIASPHSSFMPQGLVIFKSFTAIVWVLVLITIVTFVSLQYVFQTAQCDFFNRLYSEAEIETFRGSSSILIVYAYFICGSPPSLHLGNIASGKILFVIFSFSALIISSVFLGGMTTLLSNRISYPEIDSLETLEESDLFIQIHDDLQSNLAFFNEHNRSKAKLVENMKFYIMELNNVVYDDTRLLSDFVRVNKGHLDDEKNDSSIAEKVLQNIFSIAETDAFLVSVPFSAPKRSIRMRHSIFETQYSNYHVMEECLVTYPLTIPFIRYSFLFDELNRIITGFFEAGFCKLILEGETAMKMMIFESRDVKKHDAEPRAYDLNDLQSAFVGLILGLFVSFLVFVGELFIDHFRNSTVVKLLSHLRNFVRKKIWNFVWRPIQGGPE